MTPTEINETMPEPLRPVSGTLWVTLDDHFLVGRATTGRWYVAATETASRSERWVAEASKFANTFNGAREVLANVRKRVAGAGPTPRHRYRGDWRDDYRDNYEEYWDWWS